MLQKVRVRFAPSPTGHLHIGNARTALFNWLYARKEGGQFILRLEDTDQIRSSVASEEAILEDLEWLGLFWDEGPNIVGDFGPYRQSERQHIYQDYANQLINRGLAYHCYCTAEELENRRAKALAEHKLPKYDEHCRSLTNKQIESYKSEGRKSAIRFKVTKTASDQILISDLIRGQVKFQFEMIGDFVLLRSEGLAAYNFAVVIDDSLMGITHILRGEDHLSNTPKQVLLYKALGFNLPKFAHLSMITGPDHSRLSKRHGATSVSEYRKKGFLPEALVNYLALLGWSPKDEKEFLSIDELINSFSIERLNKSAAVFDPKKLIWLNGNHIRSSATDRIADLGFNSLPVEYKNKWENKIKENPPEWFREVVASVQNKLETVDQIFSQARVYFDQEINFDEDAKAILLDPLSKKVIYTSLELFSRQDSISNDAVFNLIKEISKISGVKGKIFYMALRAALSGKTTGPELQQLIFLLGKTSCIDRFRQTQVYIEELNSSI